MPVRITTSAIQILVTASDQDVNSDIDGATLTKIIPAKAKAMPLAIDLDPAPPSDVKVTEAFFQSVDNPDVSYRFYKGPAIELAKLIDFMKPDGSHSDISRIVVDPDHGLRLKLKANGGAAEYNGTVIWKVENQRPGRGEPGGPFDFGRDDPVSQVRGRTKGEPEVIVTPAGPKSLADLK